jgi:hypothetical protein
MPDPSDIPAEQLEAARIALVPQEWRGREGAYWAAKSAEDRMLALAHMRLLAYGAAATHPVERVLSVARLSDL